MCDIPGGGHTDGRIDMRASTTECGCEIRKGLEERKVSKKKHIWEA